MWNTKKLYLFLAVCLICFILILNCVKRSGEKIERDFVVSYPYFTPSADETVAILLYPAHHKRDVNTPIALIGDKEQAIKITGWALKPKKLIEGREWLEKIMDGYRIALKKAEEKGFHEYGVDVDWYIFFITSKVTPKKGYIRQIAIDEDDNTVCDSYMKSDLLKKYFDELGLTDELLAGRPEFRVAPTGRYRIPSTERTVAILLYPPYLNPLDNGPNSYQPIALFGNKELTDKLMGKLLKPKKVFEGRDWLVKIMDAYRNALKEAEENKFRRDIGDETGDIIFVTTHKGYIRAIGVDTNSVYEHYMESELLKKYFDELGLTKELLAREPNKAPQN
jgi:hypothetical protein